MAYANERSGAQRGPSLGCISAFLSRWLLNDWNHETKSYEGFLRDALWSLKGISTRNPTALNSRSPKGLRREIGLINPLHHIFTGVLMCSIKSPLCQVRRQRPLTKGQLIPITRPWTDNSYCLGWWRVQMRYMLIFSPFFRLNHAISSAKASLENLGGCI